MPNVEFNDGIFLSPPVVKAGNEAFGLWVQLVLWSAKYDTTWVPEQIVEQWSMGRPLAEPLKRAGLLRRIEDGYAVECPVLAANGRRFWTVNRSRARIPNQIRQAVVERDGWRCVECGTTADLTLDHIYPWSLGGPDTEDNLRTLCRPCNSSKGART